MGSEINPNVPIQPFAGLWVMFGIPAGIDLPAGCVRGEDLVDLSRQLRSYQDNEFLSYIGISNG